MYSREHKTTLVKIQESALSLKCLGTLLWDMPDFLSKVKGKPSHYTLPTMMKEAQCLVGF